MPDIVLATINARYTHTAFGLRCLHANLGALQPRALVVEFDLQNRPLEIVERLLALHPRLLGLGVYIWNVTPTTEVVRLLKQVRPDLPLILGGPEVSFELEDQPIVQLADYVVTGEGEVTFAALCRTLLDGHRPTTKVQSGGRPDLTQLVLPYHGYDATDLAHRTLYVEASRGCPFHCEFCLSSLDQAVRPFPLPAFLREMERLLERGARQFKFVDRTFNLDLARTAAILDFFLARWQPGLFLHFEMVPDRFPPSLRTSVQRFPAGTLQFEVGVQTLNPDVARRIHRRQDRLQLADNLRFLRQETGVYLHADLIAGLPGEDLESFGRGFDDLLRLGPHEIQLGILKRLRGTPIARHDREWDMVFSPIPPYELLRSRVLDFFTLQRLRTLARYWDLTFNSGRFLEAAPRLWQDRPSAFQACLEFSDWLHGNLGRTHSIPLETLAARLGTYLVESCGQSLAEVASALERDRERTRGLGAKRSVECLEGTAAPAGLPPRQRHRFAIATPNKKPGPSGPG